MESFLNCGPVVVGVSSNALSERLLRFDVTAKSKTQSICWNNDSRSCGSSLRRPSVWLRQEVIDELLKNAIGSELQNTAFTWVVSHFHFSRLSPSPSMMRKKTYPSRSSVVMPSHFSCN